MISFHEWQPQDFCDKCGAAFPWASWQARIWALENMLDEDGIDEPTRLRVSKLLSELSSEGVDIDVEGEKRIWGRIKELWPAVAEKAWTIAGPLITAEAKRQMGLPPI